jgi:signal transduction histidine kinase
MAAGCSHYSGRKPPEAVKGVLDLRDWNFEKDGPIQLKGDLEFYWDTLLAPECFAAGPLENIRRYEPVPVPWSQLKLPMPGKPNFYNATCRLILKTNQASLALKTITVVSAYRFWADGKLLFEKGRLGASWKENLSCPFPAYGSFELDTKETQIIMQAASFIHPCMSLPLTEIGTKQEILDSYSHALVWIYSIATCLLIIAVYCFIVFMRSRTKLDNLFLCLACLSAAYSCFTGNYENVFRNPVLDSSLFIPNTCGNLFEVFLFLFGWSLFPKEVKQWVVLIVVAASSTAIILCALEAFKISPTGSVWVMFQDAWISASCFLALILFCIAVFRRRKGSIPFMLGIVCLIGTNIYDSYVSAFSIPAFPVGSIGLLSLVVFQLIALAIRHAHAQNELALQQQQFTHVEKLATLGTLVAGVAHEINNPNNSLMLDLKLGENAWKSIEPVLDEYAHDKGDFDVGRYSYREFKEEYSGVYDRMKRNSERIKGIAEELRSFSKKDAGLNEDVDLNATVRSALAIIEHVIKRTTKKLQVELCNPAPHVRGNALYLEQVIVNLVKNACQSLQDAEKGVFVYTSRDGKSGNVTVTVRDEGKGMDEETLKNIFTPFYTTKGKEGTGLGLSICNNIIKNHNGKIEAKSKPGEGTTVEVVLPSA